MLAFIHRVHMADTCKKEFQIFNLKPWHEKVFDMIPFHFTPKTIKTSPFRKCSNKVLYTGCT